MRVVLTPCVRCGHPTAPQPAYWRFAVVRQQARRHLARGLCNVCYGSMRRADAIADYERSSRARDEQLDEWEALRLTGHTVPQAARRLGVTPAALWKALQRAKADGDPRAKFDYRGWHAVRRGEVA